MPEDYFQGLELEPSEPNHSENNNHEQEGETEGQPDKLQHCLSSGTRRFGMSSGRSPENNNVPVDTADDEGHQTNPLDCIDVVEVLPQQQKARNGLSSRKRTRQGRYLAEISLDELLQYVHLPSKQASEQLGLGLTSFKRLCREHGIQVWPYRSIKAAQAEKPTNRSQEHTERQVRPNSEAGNVGSSPSPDVDVMALDHIQMPIDAPTRALLRHQLLEVLQTSSRMRIECGFSIFNDAVLTKLIALLFGVGDEAQPKWDNMIRCEDSSRGASPVTGVFLLIVAYLWPI